MINILLCTKRSIPIPIYVGDKPYSNAWMKVFIVVCFVVPSWFSSTCFWKRSRWSVVQSTQWSISVLTLYRWSIREAICESRSANGDTSLWMSVDKRWLDQCFIFNECFEEFIHDMANVVNLRLTSFSFAVAVLLRLSYVARSQLPVTSLIIDHNSLSIDFLILLHVRRELMLFLCSLGDRDDSFIKSWHLCSLCKLYRFRLK